MRKLSLKTYSEYTLKRLSYSKSLSKKTLVKEYESNHRLFAPLLCWLILDRKIDLIIASHQCDSKLEKNLIELQKLTSDLTITKDDIEKIIVQYLEASKDIELVKYAKSFLSENQRRDEDELKNKFRNVYFLFKEKSLISDYKLCKMCNINQGNFNAFFYHNQNDKLSIKKCRLVIDQLRSLQIE